MDMEIDFVMKLPTDWKGESSIKKLLIREGTSSELAG
jgi:hypothetical protein